MENKYLVGVGVALALVVSVLGFYHPTTVTVNSPDVNVSIPASELPASQFGSAAGTEHYYTENFYGGLTTGGSIQYSSTTPTSTLGYINSPSAANAICGNNSVAEFVFSSTASSSVNMPTSTALYSSCLTNPGMSKRFRVRNSATGTVVTFLLSDTSSSILVSTSTLTSAVSSTLFSLNVSEVTAYRTTTGTVLSPTGTMIASGTPWISYLFQTYK